MDHMITTVNDVLWIIYLSTIIIDLILSKIDWIVQNINNENYIISDQIIN